MAAEGRCYCGFSKPDRSLKNDVFFRLGERRLYVGQDFFLRRPRCEEWKAVEQLSLRGVATQSEPATGAGHR